MNSVNTDSKEIMNSIRAAMYTRTALVECLLALLICFYTFIFIYIYKHAHGLSLRGVTPAGADFLNVYAAGFLVDRGQPALAYDWNVHHHVEQIIIGYDIPNLLWNYPPPFLAVAALLALAPYLWAYGLYIGIGFVIYFGVVYSLAPQRRLSLWAIAAFPGMFVNFINGQNGFITTSLFGAGFLCLEKRPWLAGLMFGLMSYKPQFFVLIPLALAVGRYGKALFSTLVTALICAGVSWLVYGAETWQAFFDAAGNLGHMMADREYAQWRVFPSLFGWCRTLGIGIEGCSIVQGIGVMLAIIIIVAVWRSETSLETRAATLCSAAFLTTPYFLNYDLVLLAVPLALLTRQGLVTGFLRYEKILLGALWGLPFLAPALTSLKIPAIPLLILGMMALCLSRTTFCLQKQNAT